MKKKVRVTKQNKRSIKVNETPCQQHPKSRNKNIIIVLDKWISNNEGHVVIVRFNTL